MLLLCSEQVFHVCVPALSLIDQGVVDQQDNSILETIRNDRCAKSGNLYDHIAQDLDNTWVEVIVILFLSILVSFCMVTLLRFFAAGFVWLVFVLSIVSSTALSAYLWNQYGVYKMSLETSVAREAEHEYVNEWFLSFQFRHILN